MNENESQHDEQGENNQQNLIGVDPLAWLSDEEKQSVLNENQEPVKTNVIESNDENGERYTLKLHSALTIRDASELLEKLNEIDDTHKEIVIEAEDLQRVDAATLQLLLGFYLFATDAGKKIVWNKPNEALCHAVELLGLNSVINLKAAA